MRISKAGIWSKLEDEAGLQGVMVERRGKGRGFTLLEIIVVMLVLGVTALLVIPRVASFSAGDFKRTLRHLSGAISFLTQESAATKETYRLYFNLDTNDYWAATVQGRGDTVTVHESRIVKRRRLPAGMVFEDVITARRGKVSEGEVFAEFTPIGIEAFTIHLREGEEDEGGGDQEIGRHTAITGGEQYSLVVNALTGRVSAFDHYVE